MRLVLTLLCRNEADIIASTIDYHFSRGVDLIIATDNGSCDGTTEILARYAERGNLILLHEPSHTHDQAIWVTRMARMAALDFAANWVINGDADEFWWPTAASLKHALSMFPDDVFAVSVQRFNFLPPGLASQGGFPFYRQQTIRERQSLNALGKPLPAKVIHRADPEISVGDGNHRVFRQGAQVAAVPVSALEILHFPVRSLAQLERKIREGAEAIARNTRVHERVAKTWKDLYVNYLQKGTFPDYYASLIPQDDHLAQALAAGDLINDDRLLRAMEQLHV